MRQFGMYRIFNTTKMPKTSPDFFHDKLIIHKAINMFSKAKHEKDPLAKEKLINQFMAHFKEPTNRRTISELIKTHAHKNNNAFKDIIDEREEYDKNTEKQLRENGIKKNVVDIIATGLTIMQSYNFLLSLQETVNSTNKFAAIIKGVSIAVIIFSGWMAHKYLDKIKLDMLKIPKNMVYHFSKREITKLYNQAEQMK